MTRRTYLQELRERRRGESRRLSAPLASAAKELGESARKAGRAMAELATTIRRLTT